jgi:ATP-dependent DNA helicase RecG
MNLDQIKKLIAHGESATLEFKKSTAQLRPTFETICAFLNGDGGTILIGVTDSGRVIGQEVSDKTKQEIANHIKEVEPPAQSQLIINYVCVEQEKYVIVFTIAPGGHMPYMYDGRAFMRNQSTTARMPQHQYEQLIVKRGQLNHSWENIYAPDCSLDDLDAELIKKSVKLAVQKGRLGEDALVSNPKEILEKFGLLRNKTLTRAAVVLFCKNEEKQFIQSQLRLARFRSTDKNTFIDNKQYVGNAFYLYDQAMTFLSNYLPLEGKNIDGKPERIDSPAIPYIVLREAIVNALCHRDYSIRGGAISVAVYNDRVEINNIGTLPQGINVENLAGSHFSVPRNPSIAKVFYTAGYIEMWGRGTQNIVEFSKEAQNPEPKFIATNIDFTVCLPLRQSIALNTSIPKLTTRQSKILEILADNIKPTKASELMPYFRDITNIKTMQRELLTLQQQNFVVSVGQGRNTTWQKV